MNEDPTKITLQTNVKRERDPTLVRMRGRAYHGDTPFDVPFISEIDSGLWQGGCETGLILPQFIDHVVSLYPWERYKINHNVKSELYVTMYDSTDQGFDQVISIAKWINECRKTGTVLVHCQAGLNRSSLVAATAMMLNGMSGSDVIEKLRKNRSPACLCNPAFEEWVKKERWRH